jgi:hypothetical protein
MRIRPSLPFAGHLRCAGCDGPGLRPGVTPPDTAGRGGVRVLGWCWFLLLVPAQPLTPAPSGRLRGRAFRALALPLLVAQVLADDHDAAVATDDLALVADRLDAWVDLHGPTPGSCWTSRTG